MPVGELLRFFAALKGVPDGRARVESRRWLERLGIGDCEKRRVEALSKGMAQKVQFIATVLHRPELLILDEPFSGLDPVNMEAIKEAILELRRQGTTILFSTHDMEVAERMCDFILMIHRGRKVLDGTLDSIQQQLRRRHGEGARRRATRWRFDRLPGVARVNDFGRLQELRLEPGLRSRSRSCARWSAACGSSTSRWPRPHLHDIFVRIAGPRAVRSRRRRSAPMRRTWVIARREYRASVRSKAFVVSLVLMPVLMAGGAAIPKLMRGRVDVEDKRVVVADATGRLLPRLLEAAELRNRREVLDPATGRQVEPRFLLERRRPPRRLTDEQRLELSQRIRKGELHAFAEIDAGALAPGDLTASCKALAGRRHSPTARPPRNPPGRPARRRSAPPAAPGPAGRAGQAAVRLHLIAAPTAGLARWFARAAQQAVQRERLRDAGHRPAGGGARHWRPSRSRRWASTRAGRRRHASAAATSAAATPPCSCPSAWCSWCSSRS